MSKDDNDNDKLVHVIKMTDEEAHELYLQGVSPEEIKKKRRYTISKKDYWDMIKKRNQEGDTTVCKCGHSINEHSPSEDIYAYPAGICWKACGCEKYRELDRS